MSRRKHVTLGLEDIEPPAENQRIVQVVGARGGNIVEVSFPDGKQTLVLLPNKFNKKLWLKRGGYVIIDEGQASCCNNQGAEDTGTEQGSSQGPQPSTTTSTSKITGTIAAVLYEDQIKQLKKMGVWPEEYGASKQSQDPLQGYDLPPSESEEDEEGTAQQQQAPGDAAAGADDEEESEDDMSDLQPNTNRKIIVHYVSEDEDDDDD